MEHGVQISLDTQMHVSSVGATRILDCLKKYGVKATFFCTVNFAQHSPDIIRRIVDEGHEVASHGMYHSYFKTEHLKESSVKLEEITGCEVHGYRMARMMPVDEKDIKAAGYTYNSSLNPTIIPGRYMNLSIPRTYFYKDGVLQLPASVTPWLRFPLFWLSYHNLPESFYLLLVKRTLKHDGYFVTYFHPWEFFELGDHPEFKLPFIIRNNSGESMVKRLNNFINYFLNRKEKFITYSEFSNNVKQ